MQDSPARLSSQPILCSISSSPAWNGGGSRSCCCCCFFFFAEGACCLLLCCCFFLASCPLLLLLLRQQLWLLPLLLLCCCRECCCCQLCCCCCCDNSSSCCQLCCCCRCWSVVGDAVVVVFPLLLPPVLSFPARLCPYLWSPSCRTSQRCRSPYSWPGHHSSPPPRRPQLIYCKK